MAAQKRVTGYAGIERDAIDLAGRGRHGALERVAVAQAQDAIGQVAGGAIGENVHQLGREIGVPRAGRNVEHHLHRSNRFQILRSGGSVHQHVAALLHRALVHGTPGEDAWIAAHRAAERGRRVARIEDKAVGGPARAGCSPSKPSPERELPPSQSG